MRLNPGVEGGVRQDAGSQEAEQSVYQMEDQDRIAKDHKVQDCTVFQYQLAAVPEEGGHDECLAWMVPVGRSGRLRLTGAVGRVIGGWRRGRDAWPGNGSC
ncbi:hypothetical protein HRR81_007305 [Exophiala dermatitidis]|uniref:Uncharacterized protein n=1 Tax=Exophiala dermatitidis (strain ATCC 34100 / CBS 525.76 / NIH/UT8656) TaxID=858893 RepID=H6C3Z1_EXODN|nr:uncharacterized protein HMPREF1120_06368 [Exophiala dermatitidis NIH/UT8656]KAJ4511236.1 hypothetical protein HRR73_006569 [Exophiala dermatitidis]EHY58356.1 hypothetical protein HMPREF1120_06368 [Exophiala dermatitidis NIH/UT8656]KAJ4566614.1 hypothetical protein HRR81_007305 [Exophiala dermatitidis]KAJ4576613.1 hypothetical protein HRR82_005557 [Exophiala dermatitidis]KAJ4617534.1 hypothetical protein HRR85_002530 [Exophiala dermatitidis]